MKLNDYREIYHPSFGKFVFKHQGSGLIVDNIFKPTKMIVDGVLKPFAEKAFKSGIESVVEKSLKSGIESVGDKMGKKVVTKAGHIFIKELQKKEKKSNPQKATNKQKEDYNAILNRLVSGEGYKKVVKKSNPQKVTNKQKEDYNAILDRLVSGEGYKKVVKK